MKRWNMMAIHAINAAEVQGALNDGWEPFAIHTEPQRTVLNPNQVSLSPVIWFKKEADDEQQKLKSLSFLPEDTL